LTKASNIVSVAVAAIAITVLVIVFVYASPNAASQNQSSQKTIPAIEAHDDTNPTLADPHLKAELVASGLNFPTNMAFVDDNGSFLALEKNTGKVILISHDTKKQILQLKVETGAEQGLLGIAVTGKNPEYVFIYMTEVDDNNHLLGNRIYRYEWNANRMTLENPKLIYEFPAAPGPTHQGGKMTIGKNGELFAVIGNINRTPGGPLCNQPSGQIDDTCVIVRMDINGQPLPDNPFVSYGKRSMDYYYAYGVRNSFGLDVDPITGVLWDTENGPESGDKIDVVHAGFNSGWSKLMGPMSRSNVTLSDLFMLNGAYYADPVFSWNHDVAVTAIKFFTSDKLGEKYKNNIFVGDYNAGQLYFFTVNKERNGLVLTGDLADKIADTYAESNQARIGVFPGSIVDLETGPDGYLYVLEFSGKIYKILPAS
jgi:glucose/arabinose dehydrogenase